MADHAKVAVGLWVMGMSQSPWISPVTKNQEKILGMIGFDL
jgi:hypothetical protein